MEYSKLKNKEKTLILLVGNIGSGKTTFCNNLKDKYYVISRDGLRYMIGNGEYIFNTAFEGVIRKATLYTLYLSLKQGFNIIMDETNMNKMIRERIIKIGKRFKYNIICVVMPRYSREFCVNRRIENPHTSVSIKIWSQIWDYFDFIYEEPSLDEGFNAIINLEGEE